VPHRELVALVIALFVVIASPLRAAAPRAGEETKSTFHADAEIDPIAYVLSGYSLHVGFGWDRARVDLGAFALDVPEFIHGDDAFDVSFHGYGVKFQYFLFAEQRGLFVGVDSALVRNLVRRRGTDLAALDVQVTAGVNAGYRFELGAGFYFTPWLGLGYAFESDDVTLDGETFEQQPALVFPAIHLGYRFR
jgi:hypothetical protein